MSTPQPTSNAYEINDAMSRHWNVDWTQIGCPYYELVCQVCRTSPFDVLFGRHSFCLSFEPLDVLLAAFSTQIHDRCLVEFIVYLINMRCLFNLNSVRLPFAWLRSSLTCNIVFHIPNITHKLRMRRISVQFTAWTCLYFTSFIARIFSIRHLMHLPFQHQYITWYIYWLIFI